MSLSHLALPIMLKNRGLLVMVNGHLLKARLSQGQAVQQCEKVKSPLSLANMACLQSPACNKSLACCDLLGPLHQENPFLVGEGVLARLELDLQPPKLHTAADRISSQFGME